MARRPASDRNGESEEVREERAGSEADQPAPTGDDGQSRAPLQADQRQVVPPARVPEERPAPEDWTPPGDHIKGYFPGDLNVYEDPENPTRSY